ncbi:IclR family transcriptional regulator [Micromonospora sp. WMMD998]|uniref:IclR family transcriptional regulator n=1 Tax=Micromonospora sp. WMMD998 TaxID=3016092 RepID=UPI002499D915|nr:IclR family transcriptional regulator [Micromonospora sp. WMMD998]WFE41106.1 IclR family transcriptional regulator [Micromonospora sp. WMMD998]
MSTDPSLTVLKAFRVLDLFRTHRQVGVSQCAELLGLTRANAHRLLVSLTAAGAVERTDSGQYRLSIWMFEVGAQVPLLRALTEQAQVPMERLVAETGFQAHLAVRDGTELIYLLKISHVDGRVRTRPGTRNPLYATSLGKILLAGAPESLIEEVIAQGLKPLTRYTRTSPALLRAELADVRRTGFAYDREERQIGVSCVATGLHDHTGRVIAAISVPSNSEHRDLDQGRLQAPLRKAAQTIEARLDRRAANLP